MPTSYTNRVITIVLMLWVALSAVYPRVPGSLFWLFNPTGPISFKDNLKPGIDMVGGTSLTYELKRSDGGVMDPHLAENVASQLKKRVDPQGVRNLIWRPQGATRIEIQMPASRQNDAAEKVRKAFLAAKDAVEHSNVRVAAVVQQVEAGADRDALVKEYGADSKPRIAIIDQMKSLADEIKAARAAKNTIAAAEARKKYDPLQADLAATNLTLTTLDAAVELKEADRTKRLEAIKARYPDFPSRLAAIDAYVKAYDEFRPLRDKFDDVARLKRDLQGAGVLSFHILVDQTSAARDDMVKRLEQEGPRGRPGDTSKWFEVDRPEEFRNLAREYNGKFYVLCSTDPNSSMINGEGLPKWALDGATPQMHDNEKLVSFQFDSAGAKRFADLTGRFSPRDGKTYQLGIVLDGKLYSAPNIQSQIFGSGQISGGRGGFSDAEQRYLVNTLNAGALSAQLSPEPISEITVGAQLGDDNLKAGIISCVAGLIIVAIFLMGYYYLAGVVAFFAVLINLVLILGSMAAINATFTLPGVAGIVLSVAMAVDANVLIFERLREEQARGLSLKMALRNSYDRAFSAIFDGQVTTAISSVFLFLFGSEEVRGFGLTLLIGIVTSLFTALFVTRTIFGILVDKGWIRDLGSLPRTFPRWNEILTPKIDWVGKAWLFTGLSAIFVAGGLALFAVKFVNNQALDIEFSGGTSVRVALKEPLAREKVQEIVDAESEKRGDQLAAPRVIAVGGVGNQFEISTPTTDAKAVQAAVIEAMGEKLDISVPSKFRLNDADYQTAADQVVFPIESADARIEGVPSYLLASHVGGVAIVLDNVEPALDELEIRSRIDQRMVQEDSATRPERVEVETFDNGRKAVVLMSNTSYVYNPADNNSMIQWRSSLASPAWSITRDAVSNPPQLKGVTSFNAQVAGEAKVNTIVAMTMSVVGIMAYIWVRFGNLKFGAATVVGCIHDALFVVAAIGYSLFLGQFDFFENVLLIKPFRLDLTLVAAVLTVIGYSMNDTVVVFDRVRENRGKFGVLSRQVINDSINQTLSRTLLTGGTSIGILLIMYIIGGDGIHGFTYAMLLGIVVGTYSSIAIAAPLLLVGKDEPASSAQTTVVRRPTTA